MKNRIIFTTLIAILSFVIASQALAQAINGDDDTVLAPTVTTDDSASEATSLITNGGDDVGSSVPAAVDNTVASGQADIISNGNDDNMTVNSNGSNTGGNDTPTGGGGSPVYSGSSGSSSGGRSYVSIATPVLISQPATTSCPLITKYMRIDWANPKDEVVKLQSFLKNIEGLNVSVTGTFNEQTKVGVEAFQRKYLNSVMGPWEATRPSGMVYITTVKKVNEIVCNRPFVLNADESAIIAKYISDRETGIINDDGIRVGDEDIVPVGPTLGDKVIGEENVASVVKASIFKRFWNSIVNIFGKIF
ncbi:MAG: peptidoglycan-binding domain-containing protein [Candidatus Paceibacterota bacterium]|jgi:hypothetical protein